MSDPRDDPERSDGRDDVDDRPGAEDRPDGRDEEDLDERVADLEARLRELRAEMTRPPEGPLGLPRPPTPREVLSFTGEYAIPTAIAVLEANVRALKMLQRVVRVLDPEHSVAAEGRDRVQSRAADASRATLDRLDDALNDVETAISEGDLPREPEARDLLADVRRINDDIRDRVEQGRERVDEARTRERDADRESADSDATSDDSESDELGDRGTTIELSDPSEADADESEGDQPQVDVEAELRSIKDEIEDREAARANPDNLEGDGNEEAEADSSDENSKPENDDDATTTDGDVTDESGNGDDDSDARTEGDDARDEDDE